MKILISVVAFIIAIYGWSFHKIGTCNEKRESYVKTVERYPKAVELIAKADIDFREACGH